MTDQVGTLETNLTTLRANLANMSESDADYSTTSESIASFEAQLSHFSERAEQYRLDWERAIERSHRAEYRDEVQGKLDEAYLQRTFFEGVIHYYEQKVQWFDNAIFPAINWNIEGDV